MSVLTADGYQTIIRGDSLWGVDLTEHGYDLVEHVSNEDILEPPTNNISSFTVGTSTVKVDVSLLFKDRLTALNFAVDCCAEEFSRLDNLLQKEFKKCKS